jgi:WNK lysine deficient protein kinase
VLPENNLENQYTRSIDIFAFGLCVLELTTKQRLDRDNAHSWPALLDAVQDPEARGFIHRRAHNCCGLMLALCILQA